MPEVEFPSEWAPTSEGEWVPPVPDEAKVAALTETTAHEREDHVFATTAELADIAATESVGTSDTLPRGDHVHAHPDLTASALGHAKFVRKTGDQAVNNSETLVNVTDLVFAIAASEVWVFEFWLIETSASINSDFKHAITVPAGATLGWSMHPDLAAAGGGLNFSEVTTVSGTANDFSGGTTNRACLIKGIVRNSTTAGNVQLQFAQNTATVEDTKILTDSYLIAHRVA